MDARAAAPLLLAGALDGVELALGPGAARFGAAAAAAGARVHELQPDLTDEDAVAAAFAALPRTAVLVADCGEALRGGGGDTAAAGPAVAGAWTLLRAGVAAHLEPAGGGACVLVAPRPFDGPGAAAAGAALESLARTTSVEWARLGVRVLVLRPGDATPDAAIAGLVAYLASPAGGYYSGCVLELGAAGLSSASS
jgi:NAD(P)-dependent dehydrogenase (short-subunit alcohol dehydrogenase family)